MTQGAALRIYERERDGHVRVSESVLSGALIKEYNEYDKLDKKTNETNRVKHRRRSNGT